MQTRQPRSLGRAVQVHGMLCATTHSSTAWSQQAQRARRACLVPEQAIVHKHAVQAVAQHLHSRRSTHSSTRGCQGTSHCQQSSHAALSRQPWQRAPAQRHGLALRRAGPWMQWAAAACLVHQGCSHSRVHATRQRTDDVVGGANLKQNRCQDQHKLSRGSRLGAEAEGPFARASVCRW